MRGHGAKADLRLLHGLKVLEVSHAVAGPTASQLLVDYGADVIKIERPGGGDMFRDAPGMGPSMFLAVNRGKKSAVIDLKKSEGLRLFYELVRVSDVIIENMGPQVAERLGITYRKIKRANPGAIYCRIESFGRGPYKNVPAFDPVLQAAVGIMSTTGFPPDKFVRAGISVVDVSAGLHAASGILALLYRRKLTGVGGELEVSLYDAASYFMSYWIARYDLYEKDTTPLGTSHVFGAPYNLFKTRDGFVYIAVAADKAWVSFCQSLGFLDLLTTDAYRTNAKRVKRKKELEKIISRRLRLFSAAEVVRKLMNSGVPISRLNTVKSLLKDPHFKATGTLKGYTYLGSRFRTTVNPAIADGARQFTRDSPPELGSDTRAVLMASLGMTTGRIETLKKSGVIST
ncbi:MAG: CaiB/BaiF CoA transferase family protein [Nitrososphaerales archaeon]